MVLVGSDDSIFFDINISYCSVSSKEYRIFRYIAISFIYHDISDISRYFTQNVYVFITALPK